MSRVYCCRQGILPTLLLEKCAADLQEASDVGRKDRADDIPALKAHLESRRSFDTDAEIDSFFKTVYPEATGFCAEEDGAVIAMLFALPLTLAHGERCRRLPTSMPSRQTRSVPWARRVPRADGVCGKDAWKRYVSLSAARPGDGKSFCVLL